MAQETAFGEADLTVYIKVDRANGSVEFYKVVDGQNVRITEQEYKQNQ